MLYIVNIWIHVDATGSGSSSNGNHGSGTPGYSTVTGSWGVRFTHSTVSWSGNWYGSVIASPADFLQSPASPRVSRISSTNISFTIDISSICDTVLIVSFVGGSKTETFKMVRPLKQIWSNITLLVGVTVSGLLLVQVTVSEPLVRLPCVSLAVNIFNSHSSPFIVKLLIELTSLSDLSSVSLVKIV